MYLSVFIYIFVYNGNWSSYRYSIHPLASNILPRKGARISWFCLFLIIYNNTFVNYVCIVYNIIAFGLKLFFLWFSCHFESVLNHKQLRWITDEQNITNSNAKLLGYVAVWFNLQRMSWLSQSDRQRLEPSRCPRLRLLRWTLRTSLPKPSWSQPVSIPLMWVMNYSFS